MNTALVLTGTNVRGHRIHSSQYGPDVAMQGVARYKDRYFSQKLFYEQAANGSLPQFVWFNPPFQASDHPCQDVAKGASMTVHACEHHAERLCCSRRRMLPPQRLLKDVYEHYELVPVAANATVAYDDGNLARTSRQCFRFDKHLNAYCVHRRWRILITLCHHERTSRWVALPCYRATQRYIL